MTPRPANSHDAGAIASIYNEGIEDRVATFETRLRTSDDIRRWFDGIHPIVIVEDNGKAIAFAAASQYRPRECYAGIAEVSVYVARDGRGRGAGRLALSALIEAARAAGYWKLLSRIFPENKRSLGMITTLGFRQVGVYEKHGQLDGVWKDVVIVERLIPENLR